MKRSITISGVAIVKDKKRTQFMQYVDIFPPYKVVAGIVELKYIYEYEGGTIDPENMKKLVGLGHKLAEHEFEKNLVFCYITTILHNEIQIVNSSIEPTFDPEVSVFSDGKKWCLLVDVVKKLCPGIKIFEGEVRKIQHLEFKP